MSIRPLSEELAAKAKKELNENADRTEDDIEHIQEWLSRQSHIKGRMEDQWILSFLRGCKFSLEKTKSKIDTYYTLKTLTPEWATFNPRDKKFQELFDTGFILSLPKTAGPETPRLILFRPGCFDPDKFNIDDVIKIGFALLQLVFNEDDNIAVAGMELIFDLKDVHLNHIMMLSPSVLKKIFVVGTGAIPFRQRDSHFINAPPSFETLHSLVKSLIKKRKQNLYVHKDLKSLFKHIPQDILPRDYGGSADSLDKIKGLWKKKLMEYEDWFEVENKFGTDESKRPGAAKTADTMFGVEGSFRQLNLD